MASFTTRDAIDANRSASPRDTLYRLAVAVNLAPQIFSHVLVEIHPANPNEDYRFDAERFVEHAITVRVRWRDDGRGCTNSSCYATYPRAKVCDMTTPTVVFPTGKNQPMAACQGACFIRQRQRVLLSAYANTQQSLFTDSTDPRRCVECDHFNPWLNDTIVRRRTRDGEYDAWNAATKEQREYPISSAFHARQAVDTDDHEPRLDTDLPTLHWNPRKTRCELTNVALLRHLAEPYWRDPSHSICKQTNFAVGENIRPDYYSSEMKSFDDRATRASDQRGFLETNTATYCRVFGQQYDEKNETCYVSAWETALTYTLLGEGFFRVARNLLAPEVGCADEAYWPTDKDLGGRDDVDPWSAKSLREWRGDVNTAFTLPPPNVTMSDLGIDPRRTGNRLYWNNFEGVLSRMPLMETVVDRGVASPEQQQAPLPPPARPPVYITGAGGGGGDGGGYDGGGGHGESISVPQSSQIAERVLEMLDEASDDQNPTSDNGSGGGGGDGDGGGGGGGGGGSGGGSNESEYTTADIQKLIDRLNSMDANRIPTWLLLPGLIGAQFGGEWLVRRLVGLLKKRLIRSLQSMATQLGGKVTASVMRCGIRLGMARMLGEATAQLTTRLVLMGSEAASVVGIGLSVAQFISMVLDVAILAGWDPGNYNKFASSEAFRPIMDAYFFAMLRENAVGIGPLDVATVMLSPSIDRGDLEKLGSHGTGTADLLVDGGGGDGTVAAPVSASSFGDTNSALDLRVSVPRWYNARWRRSFGRTEQELREGLTAGSVPRLRLVDDPDFWVELNALNYLASLRTNEFGQRVNTPNEPRQEFTDQTIADLARAADYRDVTTISAKRDVDARSYNDRLSRVRGLALGCFAGSTVTTAIAAMTYEYVHRWFSVSLITVSLLLAGFCVVVSVLPLTPVDRLYLLERKNVERQAVDPASIPTSSSSPPSSSSSFWSLRNLLRWLLLVGAVKTFPI